MAALADVLWISKILQYLSIHELATGYARTHRRGKEQVRASFGQIQRLRLGVFHSFKEQQIPRLPPLELCASFRLRHLSLFCELTDQVQWILAASANELETLRLVNRTRHEGTVWLLSQTTAFPKLHGFECTAVPVLPTSHGCADKWLTTSARGLRALKCEWGLLTAQTIPALRYLEHLELAVPTESIHDCLTSVAASTSSTLQTLTIHEVGAARRSYANETSQPIQSLMRTLSQRLLCVDVRVSMVSHFVLDRRSPLRRCVLRIGWTPPGTTAENCVHIDWAQWIPNIDVLAVRGSDDRLPLFGAEDMARMAPRAAILSPFVPDTTFLATWGNLQFLEITGNDRPRFQSLDWVVGLVHLVELRILAALVFDDVWDAPMPIWPPRLVRIHLKDPSVFPVFWIEANRSFVHKLERGCCKTYEPVFDALSR